MSNRKWPFNRGHSIRWLAALGWPIFIAGLGGLLKAATASDSAQSYVGTPLVLSEWLIAGPIATNEEKNQWGPDYFARWCDVQGRRMADPGTKMETGSEKPAPAVAEAHSAAALNAFDWFKRPAPLTFFMEAKVNCAREQNACLLLGSDGLLKAWINGTAAALKAERRTYFGESYNMQVPVSLRPGINRILFLVEGCDKSCALVAEIVPDAQSAFETLLEKNRTALRRLIVDQGKDLEIELRGAPPGLEFNVNISDGAGRQLAATSTSGGKGSWRPDAVATGIYYLTVTRGAVSRREAFFVGNSEQLGNTLLPKLLQGASGNDAIHARALKTRFDILFDPKNVKPDDPEWQRKVLYTVEEIQGALHRAENHRPLFSGVPGLHILGFKSRIDDTERHYRLYIPMKYRGDTPVPIAIMTPTALSASRPFIESAFIAHQFDAEALCEYAEEAGIGLLWPGYPALPTGNPCEFGHFDEVMDAVCSSYNIDKHRLYLMGTCYGATIAVKMAEHWPARFAALALLNPTVVGDSGDPDLLKFDAYRDWLTRNDPNRWLKELSPMPIFVVFDHGDSEHGSEETMERFLREAKGAGLGPHFDEVPSSLGRRNGWRKILGLMSPQETASPSDAPSERQTSLGKKVGPVAMAFPAGFIVVKGTGGSEKDRVLIDRITSDFQECWRENYYASCPVLRDSEITQTQLESTNLVLIGNERTNSVWNRMREAIPVQIGKARITVGSRVFPGAHLAVQAIVANPLSPSRRCVLIGAEDLGYAKFGTLNLSIDGWYDFCISRPSETDDSADVVAADRY